MKKYIIIFTLCIVLNTVTNSQTLVDFNTIPSQGTILIFAHQDDDFIWMLPWWNKVEKFICAAMPATPSFVAAIDDQQIYLNSHNTSINYKSHWLNPWCAISQLEYRGYYWACAEPYNYIPNDHLLCGWDDGDEMTLIDQINKIKAKIEPYIADPNTARIITHNNWGEYGHQHHKAVNIAVRELAVKYGKDVWMLGCDNNNFEDVTIPSGLTFTLGNYDATLFNALRNNYIDHSVWTWSTTYTPTGDHKYIKIVEAGVDKSDLLISWMPVTTTGPTPGKPGAYIFDGTDDYLTLPGNNYPSFTIGMWVRPDEIKAMDISKMTEYPLFTTANRSFYMQADGKVTAQISDGNSKTVTSTTTLSTVDWTHILMTCDGSSLKLYVNGVLEGSVNTGTLSGFISPEFVLGQTQETASFFKGQIYDVRLYDYALSAAEITGGSSAIPPVYFTMSAISGVGGSISSPGIVINNAGSVRTYTITPDAHFQVSDVKVDNVSVGAVTSYTFSNIQTDHTISATFSLLPGIALNKPTSCESYELYSSPDKANDADGTNNSYWGASPYPQWWKVDLEDDYDITGIYIRNYYDPNRYYQYEIWVSTDDVNFIKIAEKTNTDSTTNAGDLYEVKAKARFLKVVMTRNSANIGVHISDFRVFRTLSPLTWNGSVNNNWHNPGNWTPANIPVANSDVLIPYTGITNFPTISSAAICNDIVIESGATLLGNENLTVNGVAKVKQDLTTGRNWYLSSPLSDGTSAVINASPSKPLYYYNESTGTSAPWGQITNTTTNLSVMKGYVANVALSGTVNFTGGPLNAGSKQIALTRTSGQTKEGFNLVGNPYPSYLNWNMVSKADLSTNTIWYRTFDGGVYKFYTYNPVDGYGGISVPNVVTNLIPPMQAFWVRAKTGGGTLTFNNAMRAHRDYVDNKFRSPASKNSQLQILRLQVSNHLNADETVLYFNSMVSNDYDAYDSPKMSNANVSIPEIYTLAGKEPLVINGLNYVPLDTEISLGFSTGQSNRFSLVATEVNNFASDIKVMLIDKVEDREVDLTDGTPYNFTSDVVTTTSRFSIVFKSKGTTTGLNTTEAQNVLVYRNSINQIFVVCNDDIHSNAFVSVYNAVGQELAVQKLTNRTTVVNGQFASGVYLVVVDNGSKVVMKKVVIN